MIKTVELTGVEVKVEGLDGKNTAIYNKTSAAVYASCSPNVTPNADGVMEVPAGGYRGLNDTCGIVYLLGTGKVELTGTDDSVNFRQPSSSALSGGDGNNGVISGKFEFSNFDGIRSIPILIGEDSSVSEKLAAALAEETGWDLQPDRVTVLKDGEIGFTFESSSYIWMSTSTRYKVYDTNFRYLSSTSTQYCMDICETANGTVAFGFRPSSIDHINLTFVLSKNGAGQDIVLTGYDGVRWVANGKTSYDSISNSYFSRLTPTTEYMVVLNAFPDISNGGLFQDLFVVWLNPKYLGASKNWTPGDRIIVNNKRCVIVFNKIYTYGDQGVLALLLD